MSRPGRGAVLLAALLLACLPHLAHGQATDAPSFPTRGRPIVIIVPYAPGGVTDTAARLMANGLEKELATPVQVLNRPGAASLIGLTDLVRAAPNGYTIAYAVLPTVVTHYLETGRPPPYTRESFQPIAMHHHVAQVLAVRADGPFRTLRDLVEAARAAPETITVSTSGQFGVPHSHVLMLERAAGVRFLSVHYNGGAPSVLALVAGHVQVLAGGTADALPQMREGVFRVLSIAADAPDRTMPDVPTLRSLGYDVIAASATGLVAPAGTPPSTVVLLTAAVRRVIESPEHQKQLAEQGLTPNFMDADTYARFWQDTEDRMRPILRGIRSE